MSRLKNRRRAKLIPARRLAPPGSPPGTLAIDPAAAPTRATVICYGPGRLEEVPFGDKADLQKRLAEWPVVWLRLEGLGDIETLRKVAEFFSLHPLTLEDAVNIHQRPKVEPYPNYVFIVSRLPTHWNGDDQDLSPGTEQMSLCLGEKFVISFHERNCAIAERVARRLRESAGKIRDMGADYLAYTLMDGALDAFFPVLDAIGRLIDELEDEILSSRRKGVITRVHDVKRRLVALRRAVWPEREAFAVLIRDAQGFFSEGTRVYLRDCEDHAFQIIELLETMRELASDLTDLHVSVTSNRLNEVMRVLTVIATIFIPLTFIVGIYGMNFDPHSSPYNMPELRWRYGYPLCLTAMGVIAIGLVGYFWRKGWLGPQS